jgi:hypothetical protein
MSLTEQFLNLIQADGPAPKDPGPYLAKVVSHQDPSFMGNLQVELLKSTTSGNEPQKDGQLFTARYLSPFAGQTPVWSTGKNDDYRQSQQSYGMWMVPPDAGTNVLVIFAESNPNQCYWLGCVWDQYQNFAVPGNASTSLTTDGTPADFKGKKIPASEYNKQNESGIAQDPTKFLKPFQLRLLNTLLEQGLVTKEFIDEFRGITTASARRELPSSVFGISTPGPVDKTPGAPKGLVGVSDAPANVFRSRLGGTSFVMDDGNDKLLRKTSASEGPPEYSNVAKNELDGLRELPHNELVRIRTRTGHQILLHNTEDLIYIANSKGSAWVELTSDGKIDIYAKDSMSMHTEADFNLTADRNITIEAGANIAMKASGTYLDVEEPKIIKGRIQLESQKDTKMLVGQNLWVTTIGNTEYKTNGETKITSGGTSHIKSGGQHLETAPQIHMNGPAASAAQLVTALNTHILPGIPTNNALGILSQRAPQHEPWKDHENLNPLAFKVGVTDRDNVITVKNDLEFVPTADPFKKEASK